MDTTTTTAATKTQLSVEDITAAKTALTTYRNTCQEIFNVIQTELQDLRQRGFIGDAAEGYDSFIASMTPALTTNLIDPDNSATAMIDKILDSVEEQLLKTVDPQLKQNNESAAGDGANSRMA